ncbi:hypothetical protein CERSUDRAFT_147848 [Gelatoporia subvermispora B]|uniref:NAD(P)-binding protein n=1 Tax=Ceriporiopsis subvermispora (strain B) TaxID=914234 RepID=M2RUR2_CERS8|nr:hypothetical protein CERSUDRAFT_147848 [Gelatoporia subvermispora B]
MPGIVDSKCVLVIGATAGIGRALALAVHGLPSQPTVILAGRRQERLDELSKLGDRLKTVRFDVNASREELKGFVQDITSKYPDLDAVVFSSGIQHIFDFNNPETIDLEILETELNTNYVSIVRLSTFFLPHLLKLSAQGRPAFWIPISSGLAIVPKASVPGYCATKAALHSFCLSLGDQLKDTNVRVIEILPPLVESELHDHQGMTPMLSKFWMPLDTFTEQVMEGLKRGDTQIAPGTSGENWERFEKGKLERII